MGFSRRVAFFLAGVVGLYVFGYALTRSIIGDGMGRISLDPQQRAIARFALENAWLNNDNPIARLLLPAAQVERIAYLPGECDVYSPKPGDVPHPAFEAEVRFYRPYALPGPRSVVDCSSVRWVEPGP
jgi:hypothetical protein